MSDESVNTSSLQDLFTKFPSEFNYAIIGSIVLFVSTRLIKATSSHIFALLACYFIIQKLRKQESESSASFNEEMDYKLELLGAPSHFHMDTNIINLFFNIY